jgi:type IV fimbrial biogenesis protein FimT
MRGVTLLELLTSLAIACVLVLLSVPLYRSWIADMELRDRVEALVAGMAFARAEAIKEQRRVNLCPSADGRYCATGGRWEEGFILFVDYNHDGDRDDDEPIVRVAPAAHPGISVRGNKPVADYVSYTGLGNTRMVNGALQMGTLTVCRKGSNAIDVILANGGRVRVNRTKTPCP